MSRFITKPSFIIGVLIGALLAVIIKLNQKTTEETPRLFKHQKWLQGKNRRSIAFDDLRYSNKSFSVESEYLKKEVSILCIVLVKNVKNAKSANDTWAKHCNKVENVFLTTEKKIALKRDNNTHWVILCRHILKVPDNFKWILVVNDNTFALLENLRYFLVGLNYKKEYYLGHTVKFWSTEYNMGQAGYVLSSGTIKALKNKFKNSESCAMTLTYRNREDYYLGRHLASLNITPSDTRDDKSLSIFHPHNLYHVISPEEDKSLSVYPYKCCSAHTVTFQAIEGDKMYTYYYLLYTVQLFGYGEFGNRPPDISRDNEVWKNFLRERHIPETISPEQYYKIWENIVDDPTSFARHMKREEYFDYL